MRRSFLRKRYRSGLPATKFQTLDRAFTTYLGLQSGDPKTGRSSESIPLFLAEMQINMGAYLLALGVVRSNHSIRLLSVLAWVLF